MPQLNIFKRNQKGDTIVEVLASIAVIGVALAGGYALSSNSLKTGMDAAERSEALSLAQGQVEFLKNSVANNNIGQYIGDPGQPFCINDLTGAKTMATATNCQDLNGLYDIFITFDSGSNIFTIEPSWDSFGGGTRSEMTLYYKLPDDFN